MAAGAASVVLALAVYPVGSEFSVELARELAWSYQPSWKMARMGELISAVPDTLWFHGTGGAVIGFAVGVWPDAIHITVGHH